MDRMEGIMTTTIGETKCPIWGVDCDISKYREVDGDIIWRVENSYRAGGGYEITSGGRLDVTNLPDDVKARLTSILVSQWMKGVEFPRLTEEDVRRAQGNRRLPAHERADRLLRFLARRSSHIGNVLDVVTDSSVHRHSVLGMNTVDYDTSLYESALAWSESTSETELEFLNDYLSVHGWITKGRQIQDGSGRTWSSDGAYCFRVEIPGYSRIEELQANLDSAQCFVAMWFDDSMNEAYEKGIQPAIEDLGYSPLRIDRQDFAGKIDDEIIAQIRRSRFIVADFTHRIPDIRDGKCHETEEGHQQLGARGGVYYEAGFAHGLDLPVIFTCRNDMIDKVHFDTRQFNHIVWENPDDLREKLANRIGSVIGDGPNRTG